MSGHRAFVCRERDAERDCDWEVRDSDERELIESARSHLLRRHAVDTSIERLRTLVRTPVRGVGGI